MFHAISAALARLAARARDIGSGRDLELAAVNGWQVTRVAPGTYRFRDPRFDRRKPDPVRVITNGACSLCGTSCSDWFTHVCNTFRMR